jgi:hypothetical protein
MSTTATGSIKGQVTPPAPATKKAPRAAQVSVALERRRIVIVSVGLFLVLGAAIVVALTTTLPSAIIQRTHLGPRDTFGIEERNGNIVLPAANNRCRQIAFNNDTGRMVETSRPCENKPALDDKGIPVPEATMRRMDSIRQTFSKQ